jgi:hypothetical protein
MHDFAYRREAFSMVKSQSMEGQFCYMLTFAQSDIHSQDFFYMLNGHGCNRQAFRNKPGIQPTTRSRDLTFQERARLVMDNPLTSVRLHLARLKSFRNCLLNGLTQPLGGPITEHVTANESQERGG